MRAHGGRCHICKGAAADAIDHVVPVAWGGSDHPDNLAPAHTSCNSRKRDARPDEWTLGRPSMWLPGYGANSPHFAPPRPSGGLRVAAGVAAGLAVFTGVWRVREILTTTPTTPITEAVAGGAFGALVGIGWIAFLLWWLAARQDARIRAIHGVTVEQQRRERRAQRARHLQRLPAPVHGAAVAAPRILAVSVSVLVVVANVVWMSTAISAFTSGMTLSAWLDVMLTAGAVGDAVVVLAVLATPTWIVAAAWGAWWLRRRRARRGVQVLRWHT